MTPHKRAILGFIIIYVLVLFISQTHASSSEDDEEDEYFKVESSIDSHKVKLSIFYEALCPYCANFIVNNLAKIFENGLFSIINLRLIPWGNSLLKDNKTWVCQHGPDECLLNAVEACAIRVWPDLGAHFSFKFIKCVELLHLKNKHNEWRSCFGAEGFNSKPLLNCYNSGLGFQLERSYADETASLNPPHRFVPWVIVDNLPLEDDYQNFVAYVCKAYKGLSIPKACRSVSVDINSYHNSNSIGQVCNATEAKKTLISEAKSSPKQHHRQTG